MNRTAPNWKKHPKNAQVRVAYLGGSITAQDGWRPKTLTWLRQQFPAADVSEINAAIGGTGSDLGVFRPKHDVLDHNPDLLFVEFAVHDSDASPGQIYRSMEGIVRQTWRKNPATDICFVYTLAGNMLPTLQEGRFPRSASAMERVADYYGIPSIHLGLDPGTNGLAQSFGTRLPGLWEARKPGEWVSFRFRGTTARIYDLLGPDCGQVTVAVDDRPPAVKPRFDPYCTYHRLASLSVGEEMPEF